MEPSPGVLLPSAAGRARAVPSVEMHVENSGSASATRARWSRSAATTSSKLVRATVGGGPRRWRGPALGWSLLRGGGRAAVEAHCFLPCGSFTATAARRTPPSRGSGPGLVSALQYQVLAGAAGGRADPEGGRPPEAEPAGPQMMFGVGLYEGTGLQGSLPVHVLGGTAPTLWSQLRVLRRPQLLLPPVLLRLSRHRRLLRLPRVSAHAAGPPAWVASSRAPAHRQLLPDAGGFRPGRLRSPPGSAASQC